MGEGSGHIFTQKFLSDLPTKFCIGKDGHHRPSLWRRSEPICGMSQSSLATHAARAAPAMAIGIFAKNAVPRCGQDVRSSREIICWHVPKTRTHFDMHMMFGIFWALSYWAVFTATRRITSNHPFSSLHGRTWSWHWWNCLVPCQWGCKIFSIDQRDVVT